MSQSEDQNTDKVALNGAPTPVDVPRYGSLYEGTVDQRDQMRAVVYFNRKRRLTRTPTPR